MKRSLFALLLLAGAVPAFAQVPAPPTVRSGKYAVTLRVPPGGLYADEISELEFRVVDACDA